MSLASSLSTPSSSTVSSSTLNDSCNQKNRFVNNPSHHLASSNNCLDKCPKCGQKVCDHASIADVINLPNSISQDFSTYSSDSSLIKQFFNDSLACPAVQPPNSLGLIQPNQPNLPPSVALHHHHHHHYNSNKRISLNQNYYLNSNIFKQNCSNNFTFKNFMPSCERVNPAKAQTRPLSCQFMIIDNETTDKLLRDFFESKAKKFPIQEEQKNFLKANTKETTVKNEVALKEPLKTSKASSISSSKDGCVKKKKFSTFRIFMKNHNQKVKSTKKRVPKSNGFVNCITSSSTSSSSSNASSLKDISENKENTDQNATIGPQKDIVLDKSYVSLNSKFTNDIEYDEEDYTEIQNLEKCPIAASDMDLDFADDSGSRVDSKINQNNEILSSKNNSPPFRNINFKNYHIYDKNKSKTNTNTNTGKESCTNNLISVPLNSYLYYNYEKKGETTPDHRKTSNSTEKPVRKSIQIIQSNNGKPPDLSNTKTDTNEHTNQNSRVTTNNHYNSFDEQNIKIDTSNRPANNIKKSITLLTHHVNNKNLKQSLSHQSLENIKNLPHLTNSTSSSSTSNNQNSSSTSNHRSYFSSCSSCNTSSTPTGDTRRTTTTTLTKASNYLCGSVSANTTLSRDSDHSNILISPKYNSISIIFILIGLFTINFFQESVLILYFYNTEQFYWFIYSMVALFSGQTITLILSLLAEIDLINLSPPTSLKTNKTKNRKELNLPQSNVYINEYDLNYNTQLYSVFKSPFSKLFLLVPGFLSMSVYIQFFKHVFNYRKSSAHMRFKYEFQLSLYLFFNSLFHSLPLAIINACYLASTTKTYSLSWYYTELFSIFKSTSSSFIQHQTADASSQIASVSNSQTQILIDNSNNERRSNLVLLLVSIFISVSIGICLFITYYELMKQMNFLSIVKNNLIFFNAKSITTGQKKPGKNLPVKESFSSTLSFDQKFENLSLVEVLVYFCYRFCLITSRLSVIAIFWYLFNEWLLLAVFVHIFIGFMCTFFTIKSKKNLVNSYILDRKLHHERKIKNEKLASSDNSDHFGLIVESSTSSSSSSSDGITTEAAIVSLNAIDTDQKKTSKLNQHLTLFIVCLLSFIDLFMNQLSELYHMRKVFVYYLIYLIQNVSVLTYWLVRTIINAKYQLENENLAQNHSNDLNKILKTFTTTTITQIALNIDDNPMPLMKNVSPTTYVCYATIIYLCIILFTIFGLVLKFLHLHILKKRFRKLYN